MAETTRYRSGAVARMVGMPVTTLRVWERRYGLGRTATTASGHRLYAAADVERIALLKRLTQLGHAIGSIAALGLPALRKVAAMHATTHATTRGSAPPGPAAGEATAASTPAAAPAGGAAARVIVVGAALAQRLHRLARADGLWRVVGVFDDLAQATRAGRSRAAARRADLLLVHAPALPAELPRAVPATLRAWPGAHAGVVYTFGAEAARAASAAAGLELLREPHDDEALGAWVETLARRRPRVAAARPAEPSAADLAREAAALAFALPVALPGASAAGAGLVLPPRRYDDLTLDELAARAPGLACECPRHVADLLRQLAHFEAYSAQCRHRSREDADLHAHLQRVAGIARALFEQALERVALHEGLTLPRAHALEPGP